MIKNVFSGESDRGQPDMNGIAIRFNEKQRERLGAGKFGVANRRKAKHYIPSIL